MSIGGIHPLLPMAPRPADERPRAVQKVGAGVEALRQRGVDANRPTGPANIGASRILELLGAGRFAPTQAVKTDGNIVWFNAELARELGIDVPADNRLTPELHERLIAALSYRVLGLGEEPGGRPTITMYADRYGGDGTAHLGSGRAAFLPWGNLQIKGVGRTPLVVDTGDFHHAHGGAAMREGLIEALWGEVNTNLLTYGSTRVLAVIDCGDHTHWSNGSSERRALIVRAGRQLRPAHMIEPSGAGAPYSAELFVRAARDSGDLVEAEGRADLRATMQNIIDRHARTAAEHYRWRLVHGAISTSNMELDGSQLDLATQTSQPRTAPVIVNDGGGRYNGEQLERAYELAWLYDAVIEGLSPDERQRLGGERLNVRAEMQRRYLAYRRLELIKATGLKGEVAELMVREDPELVARFTDLVLGLATLRNRGRTNAEERVVDNVAAVNVFNLLRYYPEHYFAAPAADHAGVIRDLLEPVIEGGAERQQRLRARLGELTVAFGRVYAELMHTAEARAVHCYDDVASMRRSIVRRAAFENAPLDRLFRSRLLGVLSDAVSTYSYSADSRHVSDVVDKVAAASVRSVESLLRQSKLQPLPDGGFELGRRTIDGVSYALHAYADGRRRLRVAIEAKGDDAAGYTIDGLGPGHYRSSIPAVRLQREQLDALTYRGTIDGWRNVQQIPARVEPHAGGARISFELPISPGDVGQLEGLFFCSGGGFWLKDGSTNFSGFSFASPDRRELAALKAQ